jgi:hypothetical protein
MAEAEANTAKPEMPGAEEIKIAAEGLVELIKLAPSHSA